MQPEENYVYDPENVRIPSWVIFFVITLFGISVLGFAIFHRYPKSIHDYKLSIKTYQEGDIDAAEKYITSASRLVPDNKDFLSFKYYISGIKNYTEKNYDEALEALKKYQEYNTDDEDVDQLVLIMEISIAFNQKNYSKMVENAAALYSVYDSDTLCILQYASALACQYASTDDMDAYNKAVELIEKARTYELDDYYLNYIKRIEYRLNTKNIISQEEYYNLEKEGKL